MAKNYEAVREALRLTGDQKLLQLSNTFQEHRGWLKEAVEGLKSQTLAGHPSQAHKTTRSWGAAAKVDWPTYRAFFFSLVLIDFFPQPISGKVTISNIPDGHCHNIAI